MSKAAGEREERLAHLITPLLHLLPPAFSLYAGPVPNRLAPLGRPACSTPGVAAGEFRTRDCTRGGSHLGDDLLAGGARLPPWTRSARSSFQDRPSRRVLVGDRWNLRPGRHPALPKVHHMFQEQAEHVRGPRHPATSGTLARPFHRPRTPRTRRPADALPVVWRWLRWGEDDKLSR